MSSFVVVKEPQAGASPPTAPHEPNPIEPGPSVEPAQPQGLTGYPNNRHCESPSLPAATAHIAAGKGSANFPLTALPRRRAYLPPCCLGAALKINVPRLSLSEEWRVCSSLDRNMSFFQPGRRAKSSWADLTSVTSHSFLFLPFIAFVLLGAPFFYNLNQFLHLKRLGLKIDDGRLYLGCVN